jgi:hypothetical protein
MEDVLLGVDEDANMVWAVERRINGRDVPTPPLETATGRGNGERRVVASQPKRFTYQPSTPMFPHWHPYMTTEVNGRRRLVQGRLADVSVTPPTLMPEPRARVLRDSHAAPNDPAHQIEPATIPSQGLRLERRAILARGTDGLPVLWIQRRRFPLLQPPATHLRFDVFEEDVTAS